MAIVLEIVDLAVCWKIHGWTFLIMMGIVEMWTSFSIHSAATNNHRPINCKNYGKWGDSVALEIGWQ
jgi:hypothetical protein